MDKTKTHLKKGQLHGKKEEYAENGQLLRVENFSKGKIRGDFKIYNEDGSIEQEGSYGKNEIEGIVYHSNGKKSAESRLKGTIRYYKDKGTINIDSADLVDFKNWDEEGNLNTEFHLLT